MIVLTLFSHILCDLFRLPRTIAVWDISEAKYWHPNMSKNIKRYVPSQITSLTFENKSTDDFGRCIDIRSLTSSTDVELVNLSNPIQVSILFFHCLSSMGFVFNADRINEFKSLQYFHLFPAMFTP